MEKAYDLKGLVEKCKGQGLPVLEDGAEKLVIATFEWLSESAMLSKTPLDDVAVALYPYIKALALKKVDLIDGQVGI